MRLFPVILFLMLQSCRSPGHGPKAERGYHRAEPVIAALEAFARDSGVYPRSLEALVPGYLDGDALALPSQAQEAYPFEYTVADSTYRLSFRYVGPGMNKCTFHPLTKWACTGHF